MSGTQRSTDVRNIILTSVVGADEWDVQAPATVEVHRLINRFIKTPEFGFKATDDNGNLIPYRLMWKDGDRYLGETETLSTAGVLDTHTLVMAHEARAGA